uniref:Uncharacterized protein n=1 Tax=Knipowitschia caucasica TaxID=637954 RepID=A0AAV2KXI8_KNICA
MMDDALSESDNIFSQSPEPDRPASGVAPALALLSVCEVQLLCSLTPLATPISAALGLCKLELTTQTPRFSKPSPGRADGVFTRLLLPVTFQPN